jgi:6-phosphogluconolactonase
VRDYGSLGEASQVIQHQGSSVDPRRQAGPHAHAVVLDSANRHAFVADLGLDRVMIYRFDARAGRMEPNPDQPWIASAPGAGPRQLVMHPQGGFAYVINELDSTISALRYDAETGPLAHLQTLATLPEGFAGHNTCAEVEIAPSGLFVYGSNRGHDSVAIFAVDAGRGTLRPVGHEPTRGHIPRNFALSPSGAFLLAANQDTNNIVVFRIDQATGQLAATGHRAEVGTPICVRFL